MSAEVDPAISVQALLRAMPYLRPYQGETFVIKAGGEVFQSEGGTRALADQVGVLHRLGVRVVLVHGGGAQASALAETLGLEVRKVDGRRVTDAATRDVATMAFNGTVNTRIVATFRELDLPAVGISGVSGDLVRARRRPPRRVGDDGEVIDFGYVGDIEGVDPRLVTTLLDGGFLPVVSPLSASEDGTVLNVNADVVSARLARALGAKKLIMVTGARGVLEDPEDESTLVSYTDAAGLERLEDEGCLAGGMLPKADAIRDALMGGVPRVHVISYQVENSLLVEIFTNEGSGTMVVQDIAELRPAEHAKDEEPV